MRKYLCSFIFTVITIPLFALDSKKAHLSFEPFFSWQYGKVGEYLHYRDTPSSDYKKISYLEWEEKPLWLYGSKINASYKHLYSSLSITSALSTACGKMYDSDWLNRSDNDLKTNYSISDNRIHSYIDLSGTFGYIFRPESNFRIIPTAEIGYYNLLFKGKGGEGWYGDVGSTKLGYDVSWNDPRAVHFTMSGDVIEYNQYSLYTFLGCQFVIVPSNRLEFDLAFAVSPYSYIVAVDTHLLRSLKFKDEADSYFKTFKAHVSAYYSINDIFTAGLSFGGLYNMLELGNTYTSSSKKVKYARLANEKGGSDVQNINITASLKINIF